MVASNDLFVDDGVPFFRSLSSSNVRCAFQDHMRAQDWDPKTFFAMHDLNGDKFWDEDEVRVSQPNFRQ